MKPATIAAALGPISLGLPVNAHAHLVTSGLGPWYDGVLHLLASPAGVLGVVTCSLLAGLRGAGTCRLMIAVLPLSWLVGGGLAMGLGFSFDLPWFVPVSFLMLGLLVAADLRIPTVSVAVLGSGYGTVQGVLDGSALEQIDAGLPALLGTVTAVALLVLLTAGAVVYLQGVWARIAVRVMGSWVSAVGLLMLGWLARPAT